MLFLVVDDVFQVVVIVAAEACCEEFGLGELAYAALVENVFEVLECESILKDVNVGDCAFGDRDSGRESLEEGKASGEGRKGQHF